MLLLLRHSSFGIRHSSFRALLALLAVAPFSSPAAAAADSAASVFRSPPPAARPHVMWMWMGSNITKTGITHDLEKLRDAGFGGTLLFSLADTTTPWPRDILDAPTPEVIAFTPPWWERIRHAAVESHRLGLDFGMSNCPGYSSSGGPWIKPEHFPCRMVVWSETRVQRRHFVYRHRYRAPTPDSASACQRYPVWNPENRQTRTPRTPRAPLLLPRHRRA